MAITLHLLEKTLLVSQNKYLKGEKYVTLHIKPISYFISNMERENLELFIASIAILDVLHEQRNTLGYRHPIRDPLCSVDVAKEHILKAHRHFWWS